MSYRTFDSTRWSDLHPKRRNSTLVVTDVSAVRQWTVRPALDKFGYAVGAAFLLINGLGPRAVE